MTRLGLIGLVGITCFFTSSSLASELTIAVATNFLNTVQSIGTEFQDNREVEIRYTAGSSGRLYAQIRSGAPFDIFMSADQERVDAMVENELGVETTRFTYAIGRLAFLLNPKKSYKNSAKDILENTHYVKIVIANPKIAPYGRAAKEVLEAVDTDPEKVKTKISMTQNIGQAFSTVWTGNADVGLVALSSILDQKVKKHLFYLIPNKSHNPIRQDAIVVKRSNNIDLATDFLEFLKEDAARSIIRLHGYEVD